jgi:hypothetical protein
MSESRHPGSVIRGTIAVLLIAGLPLTACYWCVHGFTGNGCTGTTVTEIAPPTVTWSASVIAWLCESPFLTDAVVEMQRTSARDATRSAVILGVDTGGHDDERPRIVWTAPYVLQVIAPNRSYLNVTTLEYNVIRIDLRFDPDDSEDRARWLKEKDHGPDGTPIK